MGCRPDALERNVATLVSRLRGQLGAEVVAGDHRGYRLGAARVDVKEAARLVDEAGRRLEAGTPAVAAAAADRALELLGTGTALVGDPDADWVDALRDEVRTLLRSARHLAAEAALRTGRGRTAELAVVAVADDRFDETAYRLLMRGYREVGEPGRALATYHDLATLLRDELGAEPRRRPAVCTWRFFAMNAMNAMNATSPRRSPSAPGPLVQLAAAPSWQSWVRLERHAGAARPCCC